MKKWVCPVCGYVHEGDTPPEKCPVCGVPGDKFKLQESERVWADEHKVGVAKGLDERNVLWRHVFRNALIPLVTGFPAAFIGAFFTGSLLIETLFSLDGLGLLSYESVIRRDYPVVLGSLYVFTLIGLVTKLVSDLCYVWIDPRINFDSVD